MFTERPLTNSESDDINRAGEDADLVIPSPELPRDENDNHSSSQEGDEDSDDEGSEEEEGSD